MRLGDLDNLKTRVKQSKIAKTLNVGMQVFVETEKTIDPETLPLVQELRAELAKVTAERDDALKKLKMISQTSKVRPLKKRKYFRKCGVCDERHEQSEMIRTNHSPNGWICFDCHNAEHPEYDSE